MLLAKAKKLNVNNKPIISNSLNKLKLFSNHFANQANNNNKIIKKKGSEVKSLIHNNLYKEKLFPIYYYFLDFIFDRLIQPKKFMNISEKYLIVYNFMNQLYDISTYLLLYKQFQLLKISLDREKRQIINEHVKININNDEFMNHLDNDLRSRKFPVFSDIAFNNS